MIQVYKTVTCHENTKDSNIESCVCSKSVAIKLSIRFFCLEKSNKLRWLEIEQAAKVKDRHQTI